MRHTVQRFLLASGLLLFALAANAVIVQLLDLDKLTNDATVIVAGQVISVQEVAETTVRVGNRDVPAKTMTAELRVSGVLKGNLKGSSSLILHYVIPDEFVGWPPVVPLSYRVFFLVGSSGEFALASPYHPSIVAVPDIEVTEGTAIERVIAQLSAVLESPSTPSGDKRDAVFTLSKTTAPAAVHALSHAANVKDPLLRLSAASALLEHNDISTLPLAEAALLRPDPAVPGYLLHNLSYAILVGVRDDKAVPALTRLLRATSAETRRAAASALMHTGATSAIDPLLSAIDDPDSMVQYYAVVGLAEITGQTDWRPNTFDFTSDPKKYLAHWREFAKSQ
jgi:hypothetical protein